MSQSSHWENCYLNEAHPLCRLLKIHDLQKEVQTLKTQLQYERTGHLVPWHIGWPDGTPSPTYNIGTPPCYDIEPPKIATHSVALPTGNPHFTHHGEDPPSATP